MGWLFYHGHFFQDLQGAHIQLNELWADVRQAGHHVWVWAATEAATKIVPVLRPGPRTLHLAYAVIHKLHQRQQPGFPRPVFTTDGLCLCFFVLTAHFGHRLQPEGARRPIWQLAADFVYGQVRKFQRRRRLVKVERVVRCGQRETLIQSLKAAGCPADSTPPSSNA